VPQCLRDGWKPKIIIGKPTNRVKRAARADSVKITVSSIV